MIMPIKNNENGYDKSCVNDEDEAIVKAFLSKIRNQRKRRTCLMCGAVFDSSGPYNRRCRRCARLIEKERCEFNMPYVYKCRADYMINY